MSAQAANSRCDSLIASAVEGVLKTLDQKTAEAVRLDIEGSKAHWERDRNYERVRESVAKVGKAQSLVRLEVGRAPGGRYTSLWFVDTGVEVLEFATGPESEDVWTETISRENWAEYVEYLEQFSRENLSSLVSPAIVDAPVYFLCLNVSGHEMSLVVEAMPEDVAQFSVIARTFGLSRSKKVPRELQAYARINEGSRKRE